MRPSSRPSRARGRMSSTFDTRPAEPAASRVNSSSYTDIQTRLQIDALNRATGIEECVRKYERYTEERAIGREVMRSVTEDTRSAISRVCNPKSTSTSP